ncbi:TPR end-of-group domain-containing protein [Alkaliphilus transvaalensis]|uniref:TPR end-of-group domain-containing protein n=1 Tax=Alkaliphilus transvaalensis TaxID=114628 RepID=UPI00047A3EAE|nr:alpha/beta hydrolase-fold protein [Alkaliphilus transvaalensis]
MEELQFDLLKKLIFDCYGRCRYEKALDFAKLAAEAFPEKMPQTSYWLACLYSRLENTDQAMTVLNEAIDKKIWWSPKRLMSDEDLLPLQKLEAFQYILQVNHDMEKKAMESAKAGVVIYTPTKYKETGIYPLLLSLHWQNGNANEYSQYWRNAKVLEDFILAFPQSSQISAVDEYHWNDEVLAEKEIKETYQNILKDFKINRDKMLITGTSQGAKLAIKLALKNQDQCYKGFIAVIPIISEAEIEELIPQIYSAAMKGIRGCIIASIQDIHYSNTIKLYETFIKAKFPCKLIKINTIGHQLPEDLSKKLKRALSYVL